MELAWVLAIFSGSGLNGSGATFQRDLRDRVVTWPDPARPRPVHYNCWEAVYFNHNIADLAAIADRAADMGAERFVLDDGWFGRRDDDTTSLGDWTVDRRKWPDGLHPLIAHVHKLGMTFGLWFEPEMVNPDSDLMRAHPDWMLGPADQVAGRNQMVLDLSKAQVRDYLFNAVSNNLAEYSIHQIKSEYQRPLPFVTCAPVACIGGVFGGLWWWAGVGCVGGWRWLCGWSVGGLWPGARLGTESRSLGSTCKGVS